MNIAVEIIVFLGICISVFILSVEFGFRYSDRYYQKFPACRQAVIDDKVSKKIKEIEELKNEKTN